VAPVPAITAIEAGGVPVTDYQSAIDRHGQGWLKFAACRSDLIIRYDAGLGSDWNAVPEPLRQGIIRLVAHLYSERDDPADTGPPAAVAALWQPWRRLRL
jgi:uncharacterized phiE125 gp8 family phage protein